MKWSSLDVRRKKTTRKLRKHQHPENRATTDGTAVASPAGIVERWTVPSEQVLTLGHEILHRRQHAEMSHRLAGGKIESS
ncbi:hypothetical protein RB195_012970 [Necator americanus]|uniref:Uncharacterized protein n=1 Tax=Necator americanus TaxID=51031 RepID=A0ABR1DTM4_NECAM